jgi:hypothetical protein
MDTVFPVTQIAEAGDTPAAADLQPTLSSPWLHGARSPGESSHGAKLWPARILPDPAICRAKAAGFGGYANCLVESPSQCRQALGFGFAVESAPGRGTTIRAQIPFGNGART